MKKIIVLGVLILMIFAVPTAAESTEPVFELNSTHDNQYINSSTTLDGQNLVYNNQSLILNNAGGVIISNSVLNFSKFVNTGLVINNTDVTLFNSTIIAGDDCISGTTSGTLTMNMSTIVGCLDDGVNLVGDYNVTILDSIIMDVGGKGFVLEGSSTNTLSIDGLTLKNAGHHGIDVVGVSATIADSHVDTTVGDGIKFSTIESLDISGTIVNNTGDEGIQVDAFDSMTLDSSVIDSSFDRGADLAGNVGSTLFLSDTEFVNIGDDGLRLDEINAKVHYTLFDNIGSDGIQTRPGAGDLEIYYSDFYNLGKDGLNLEASGVVNVTDSIFEDMLDEGMAIDFADKVIIDTVSVLNVAFDAIRIGSVANGVDIYNLDVAGSDEDGLQIRDTNGTITIDSSSIRGNGDNGIEFYNIVEAIITNTDSSENGLAGLESLDSGEIAASDSEFSDNMYGLYLNNTERLIVTSAVITNNDVGVWIGHVTASTITQTDMSGNTLAVNATGLNDFAALEAGSNYWGTSDVSAINVVGNVNIQPILNSNFGTFTTNSSTTDSTSAADTSKSKNSSSEDGFLSFGLVFLVALVATPVMLRRRMLR